MKTDDPRLTAFALGELPQSERGEIERELRLTPSADSEVRETREMAGILTKTLHAQPAPALAEHQRWAILRLAAAVEKERRGPGMTARNVIEPSWWQRVGTWQAIAACAVFGFGVYAFSVSLSKPGRQVAHLPAPYELTVAVPKDADLLPVASGGPEILTPQEAQRRIVAAGGPALDAAKVFPNGAVIVPPRLAEGIKLDPPAAPVENPALAAVEVTHENERTIISIPDNARMARKDYEKLPGVKKPSVLGSPADMARASVGAGDARPPSDEMVGTYLLQRMKDAERLREGASAAEFGRVFRADPAAPGRYEMIRCKSIKVDAEFVGADGSPIAGPPPADARLARVSRPYLDVK